MRDAFSVVCCEGALAYYVLVFADVMASIVEVPKDQARKPRTPSTSVDTVNPQPHTPNDKRPFRITERPNGVHVICDQCNQEIAFFENYRTACFEAYRWANHACEIERKRDS